MVPSDIKQDLAHENPLVVNLGRLVQEHLLVAMLGRLVWECLLVAYLDRLVHERPMMTILAAYSGSFPSSQFGQIGPEASLGY